MQFSVDSTPVNSRTDWRHVPLGLTPQTRRVEMYPGIAERFVIRDVPMPGGVMVTGFLDGAASTLAAAITQVKNAIVQWSTVKAIGSTHTVQVHDDEYEECYLEEFEVTGPFIPIAAVNFQVKLACKFTWIQTKAS